MIQHLVGASNLLGAQVMVTGVSASVAQLVVANDVKLPEVQSFGQLQDGLSALMHEQIMTTTTAV
ncbi:MAG: hypothetical protein HGA65_04275 [Oscillochloris sp.]|nr:hypothetical protein [Oscillochloris sp.]